jgi:hypothetical protein
MKTTTKTLLAGLLLALASCDDDKTPAAAATGAFFLSINGETAAYILRADDLETGELSIHDNTRTLEQTGHTWIFSDAPPVALGLIYQQGDPGIGLAIGLNADGTLRDIGSFQVSSRYTSYGFFDRHALTSVGGQPLVSDGDTLKHDGANRSDGVTFNIITLDGALSLRERTIPTLNITGNGDQATFSGIVDAGNGEFLTGLVLSRPRDPSATGGSSSGAITYPDSVWVAALDANLSLKRLYRDDRISYSSGRYRSQYYSQIAKADDGIIYVFSGAYETTTTRPCGALRVIPGATAFDPAYYFNIQEKTGGHKFRKVWHVTGNHFLLEMYNDLTPTATGAASWYGLVNVEAKTFTPVTGLPAPGEITSTGLPMSYNGELYLPVTAAGQHPAIYIINPLTATARAGLRVTDATTINAVGRLAYP